MVKLILQVNPRAGSEEVILRKINEVFDNPFMSQIEQLSDFFLVLDFTPENVEKVTNIQDLDGILDVWLTPVDIAVSNLEKASAGEDYYIVFIDVEKGKHVETMERLLSCGQFKIRNAGYFYDDRADIILEVISSAGAVNLNHAIRDIEGVEDTILYTLPHSYE